MRTTSQKFEDLMCEDCQKLEHRAKAETLTYDKIGSKITGSPHHRRHVFKSLAVSNVSMRTKQNSMIDDKQGQQSEVFSKSLTRHVKNRLKLPNSFKKQHIKHEPAISNFFKYKRHIALLNQQARLYNQDVAATVAPEN